MWISPVSLLYINPLLSSAFSGTSLKDILSAILLKDYALHSNMRIVFSVTSEARRLTALDVSTIGFYSWLKSPQWITAFMFTSTSSTRIVL